jgi:hypothetical protein
MRLYELIQGLLASASMTNSLGLWKVRIPSPGIVDSLPK